jgi:hypothetical protein
VDETSILVARYEHLEAMPVAQTNVCPFAEGWAAVPESAALPSQLAPDQGLPAWMEVTIPLARNVTQ